MVARVRVSWDKYFLGLAEAVSVRADCTRRQVGAVIVDEDHRVVSTGYNGAPPGGKSCLAGECPRGKHFENYSRGCQCSMERVVHFYNANLELTHDATCNQTLCGCGKTWPCDEASVPGSSYDTGVGACIALHAEQNAIIWADINRLKGATLYCTDEPCDGCARLIAGVGITTVRTWDSAQA